MPRRYNSFVFPKRFCNKDCNSCEIPQNRQFSLLINILYHKYGKDVYRITQAVCPNMTCCADCRIDDFCHDEDCEIEAEAVAYLNEIEKKDKQQ